MGDINRYIVSGFNSEFTRQSKPIEKIEIIELRSLFEKYSTAIFFLANQQIPIIETKKADGMEKNDGIIFIRQRMTKRSKILGIIWTKAFIKLMRYLK